jgi:hypothetical protein
MKKIFIIAILSVFVCGAPHYSYAHSGRTDSSGGHKDNKNASGLGAYHYHHGYKAHLHSDGLCPYDSVSENKKEKNNESASDSAESKK